MIALAVQTNAPISVADEIMADASWDLADPIRVVERILQAGDEASLRRAAAEPIVGRVAQALLERGMRYVQEKAGHRTAEVVLETRQPSSWKYVWLTYRYGQGSSGGGNVSLPLDALPVVIARFKLMANLDLAEQHARQQGHTSVQHKDKEYDLQVTTEPTEHGEKVTLRLELREGTPGRPPD